MSEVLTLTHLTQSFGPTTVLRDLSLTLQQNDRLAVIGSSGSGKTTLLRLIAGLEAPTGGEVFISGKLVSQPGRLVVAPEYREVAMVFQGLALFPHLRALDQIAFAARGRGGVPRAKDLLHRIGLGHRAEAALDQLSGGERQRIALARALAQEPKLILMDEPFASLDDEKRSEMRGLLRTLLDESNTTLILVTHSRDDALDLASRLLVLDQGRPVVADSLEAVLECPRHAAAVRCLALGQIVRGHTTDGETAETAFGPVTLSKTEARGAIDLLIRPGQARISIDANGVPAEVIAIELRPPDTQAVRRIAVVRVGGEVLRVQLDGASIQTRQSIRIVIHGPCRMINK